jgi:hypothetical protein
MSVCPVKQKFYSRKWTVNSFKENSSLLCDSLHAKFHLQCNVASINKRNINYYVCDVRCLEELQFQNPTPAKQVMSTLCGHMFCCSCIALTINKRQECPVCRKDQTIENIHHESGYRTCQYNSRHSTESTWCYRFVYPCPQCTLELCWH